MDDRTLAGKLRRLLRFHKLSHVARAAGLSNQQFHQILKHGATPRTTTLRRLSRVLGVSLDWLTDDTRGMPPVWIDDYRGLPREEESASSGAHASHAA